MIGHIHFGLVSISAPSPSSGPLAQALNNRGLVGGGPVTMTVPGWFCRGCLAGAPERVGVLPFVKAHSKCGGET